VRELIQQRLVDIIQTDFGQAHDNGKYPLPDKARIGVDFSEDALKKYPFAGDRPMARVSYKDGSVAEW
jgi:hypothetical protein